MQIVFESNPVNKTAAIVASQSGCSDTVFIENKEELQEIIEKIKSRRDELKKRLGIKTHSQLKNRMYCRNCGKQRYKIGSKKDFEELLELGIRMQEMNKEIAKKPATKKLEFTQVFMNVAEDVLPKDVFLKIKQEALKRVKSHNR